MIISSGTTTWNRRRLCETVTLDPWNQGGIRTPQHEPSDGSKTGMIPMAISKKQVPNPCRAWTLNHPEELDDKQTSPCDTADYS